MRHFRSAKLLLKHGAKVNRQMAKQRLTPLMTAVKQGNEKVRTTVVEVVQIATM